MDTSSKHIFKPPPMFSPARKSLCLCGSGLTFKRCCSDRLPEAAIGDASRAAIKKDNYHEALLACRADITQYTIWHKSHTEPLMRRGIKPLKILDIDIKALGELVDKLQRIYSKTNAADDFPAVLERLRTNIGDERWQRKIIFFHAVQSLGKNWNEESGRKELRKLGSFSDETDVETLQLALDLFHTTLSFSQRLEVIDHILQFTDANSDRIHYRGAKGIEYFLIGDTKRAKEEMDEAILIGRAIEEPRTAYETQLLGLALSFLGAIESKAEYLDEAINLFERLLGDEVFTDQGKAELLRDIGDAYRYQSRWQPAYESYVKALGIEKRDIYRVFLSECHLRLGNHVEAQREITAVSAASLNAAELVDYALTLAAVAIQSGNESLLGKARITLKNMRVDDSHFRTQCQSALLDVTEVQTSGSSATVVARALRRLAGVARSMGSYLILKPSFMGMGIDLGKLLQDLSSDVKSHSDQQKH